MLRAKAVDFYAHRSGIVDGRESVTTRSCAADSASEEFFRPIVLEWGSRGREFESRRPDHLRHSAISPSSASAEAACAMSDHGSGNST